MTTSTNNIIDLRDERETVRRTLSAKLMNENIWQIISADWFQAWKEYVDFNNRQISQPVDKERERLYPGPIDNSSLAGDYEGVIKQGLVESRDYILLPNSTAEMLYKRYQGGPKYLRSVVNVGTVQNSLYQIEVYPIVLAVYDCNKTHPQVLPQDKPHYITVSKKDDIAKFIENYRVKYLKKFTGGLRCWVKMEEETTPPILTNGNANITNKERKMTVDITDKDGPWMYMRQTRGLYFADLLGEKLGQVLEIIAEFCDASFYNTYDSSPRAPFLNKWKENLRVGDVVDAQDKMGSWLEACVVEVNTNGSVDVHFKGWPKNFDENIAHVDIMTKIQPLYTRTKNWRDCLSEDDEVEINTGTLAGKTASWEIGTVMERDVAGGRVKVRVASKPAVAMAIPVLTDDDMKKLRATPSTALPVEATAYMDVDSDAISNSSSYSENSNGDVWVDLNGDLICSLDTHLQNRSPRLVTAAATALTSTNSDDKYMNTEIVSSGGLSTGRFRSTSDEDEYGDKNVQGRPLVRGAVGLQNLGNTCFMNSVLQCLSNTQPLTQYFLEGRHIDDLNRDNVLGHGGKVALAYAKLIKDLWCDGYVKVVPRAFKRTIGEFQPQFAGYQQQDSQELMGFLLDGLHEDLNRRKTKPAVSKIESNGRPDELVAREAWRRFLLRNDSEIVDRVYGLLKSHVTCKCGRESVTFDPFNTLSLPIPAQPLSVIVRLLPQGSPPLKVFIEVEPTDSIKDVRLKLIEHLVHLGRLPATALSSTISANEFSPSPTPVADDSDDSDYVKVNRPTLLDPGSKSKTSENFSGNGLYSKAVYIQRVAALQKMQQDTNGQMHSYLPPLTMHLVSIWSHNPSRIAKVHLADNATAIDFMSGRDTLIAFQLEHPAPVKSTSTYSSAHGSTYSSYYTSSSSSPIPADTKGEPYVVAVDMYISKAKKNLSPYNSMDLSTFGMPHRFVITKETTGKELYALVWAQVYRYVKQGSESKFNAENFPFVLNISNTWANGLKGPIIANDDVVTISGDQVVAVCWKDEADNDEHFDIVEFERCITLPLDGDRNQDRNDINCRDDGKMEVDSSSSITNTTRSSIARTFKKPVSSVYTCLDKFCEREQLNEEETLYCAGCKQHVAPVKQLDLYATPDILIIQLKRFQYIPGQYFVHREKINDFVDFPLTGLDLRKYVKGQGADNVNAPPIYDLYAVSLHSGGLGGGHYTAVCKSPENSKWYNFNDSSVSETSPESAVCEQSYVLFYRRQRGSLRWAGLTPLPDPGLPDEA